MSVFSGSAHTHFHLSKACPRRVLLHDCSSAGAGKQGGRAGGWRGMLCWARPSWAKLNWDAWHQRVSLSLPSWVLWGSWELNYLLRSIQSKADFVSQATNVTGSRVPLPQALVLGPLNHPAMGLGTATGPLLAQGMEALRVLLWQLWGQPVTVGPVRSDLAQKVWESGILKWACGH